MSLLSTPGSDLPAVASVVNEKVAPSKFRHLLDNQSDAHNAHLSAAEADLFGEQNELLAELRVMFNWLAQEPGAKTISRARFLERAPELERKFPQIASSFAKISEHGRGNFTFEEFQHFCLNSRWLQSRTRKLEAITVFGCDAAGNRTYKEHADPEFMCELSSSSPLLPWEVCHVAEWRIKSIQSHPMWDAPTVAGLPYPAGKHFDSSPFHIAGARGFLRFWPAGQFNSSQQRLRAFPNMNLGGIHIDESHNHASGARGCCIGLVMPPGTHLTVRFFVGEAWSQVRELTWSSGGHAAQVWAPVADGPPCLSEGECLVAGVEILKNFGVPRKLRPRCLLEATRSKMKPRMQEFAVSGVLNGVCQVHRNQIVPGFAKTKSLPILPQALVRQVEDTGLKTSVLSSSVRLPRLSFSNTGGLRRQPISVHIRPGPTATTEL